MLNSALIYFSEDREGPRGASLWSPLRVLPRPHFAINQYLRSLRTRQLTAAYAHVSSA